MTKHLPNFQRIQCPHGLFDLCAPAKQEEEEDILLIFPSILLPNRSLRYPINYRNLLLLGSLSVSGGFFFFKPWVLHPEVTLNLLLLRNPTFAPQLATVSLYCKPILYFPIGFYVFKWMALYAYRLQKKLPDQFQFEFWVKIQYKGTK